MTIAEARRVGGRCGLRSALVGLTIAYLVMAILSSGDETLNVGWIIDVEYKLNLVTGAMILLVNGYYWGQLVGRLILINKYNHLVIGILCGLVTLSVSVFCSGWVGFFQEMHHGDTVMDLFMAYVIRPVIVVTIYGAIPAILTGLWMGSMIKSKHHLSKMNKY